MTTPPDQPLVPPSPPAPADPPAPAGLPAPSPPADPYPAPYPYAGAGWPQQHAPAQPGWGLPESQALQEAHTALRKARTALGWAIGATVGAFLAIVLAVVGLLLAGASASDDDFAYEPLRGEVVGLPDGSALGGDRLEHQLVDLLREYGAEDIEISCPDTPAVTVSTAVVCSGDVEGFPWTGIVFFEDTEGTFVVVEV